MGKEGGRLRRGKKQLCGTGATCAVFGDVAPSLEKYNAFAYNAFACIKAARLVEMHQKECIWYI